MLSSLLESLASGDFKKREEAQTSLLALSEDYLTEVVLFLWSDEVVAQPEIRFRREELLSQVFQRSVLGVGRASTGIVWGRFLYLDKEEKLPAAHAFVENLAEDSIAKKAGLKISDVVLACNGELLPVGDPLPLLKVKMAGFKPGEEVELTVKKINKNEKKHRRAWMDKKPLRKIKFTMGSPETNPVREEVEGEFEKWKRNLFSKLRLKGE